MSSGFYDDYTAVDLETTGFSESADRIIEFGAVRVRHGRPVATFRQLVNPGRPVPKEVASLTGIGDADLAEQPMAESAMPEFIKFIGSDVLVGHNINLFDSKFIAETASRIHLPIPHNPTVDTLEFSRALFPDEPHHRLVDLIRRFGIAQTESHRAAADALQTAQCYEYMKRYVRNPRR